MAKNSGTADLETGETKDTRKQRRIYTKIYFFLFIPQEIHQSTTARGGIGTGVESGSGLRRALC